MSSSSDTIGRSSAKFNGNGTGSRSATRSGGGQTAIYLCGGNTGHGPVKSVFTFNPVGPFADVAGINILTAALNHSCPAMPTPVISICTDYTRSSPRWEILPSISNFRHSCGAAMINDRIFVTGGLLGTSPV